MVEIGPQESGGDGGAASAASIAGAKDVAALIAATQRVAWQLFNRAMLAHDCGLRLSLDEAEAMSIDERVVAGDVTAMYDAIVEAREQLDEIRGLLGEQAAGDKDVLERIAAVRASRLRAGDPKQEAAATDRGGRERQRSRMTRRAAPKRHG